MSRRKRQARIGLGHQAVWSSESSDQASTWDKPEEWFVKGLERFANADDSLQDYQALANSFASFWPLRIEDADSRDLSWVPEAHPLFLFYRNLLRRFWTRDAATLKSGFYTPFLFGTLSCEDLGNILTGETGADTELQNALVPLRRTYLGLRLRTGMYPLAYFWLDWSARTVAYVSHIDFQRAVWLLFRDSWRAKVCPKCSAYFLVQKSAQMYCSLSCSNAVHQASSLRWWKEKGAGRRAAKTRSGNTERKRR